MTLLSLLLQSSPSQSKQVFLWSSGLTKLLFLIHLRLCFCLFLSAVATVWHQRVFLAGLQELRLAVPCRAFEFAGHRCAAHHCMIDSRAWLYASLSWHCWRLKMNDWWLCGTVTCHLSLVVVIVLDGRGGRRQYLVVAACYVYWLFVCHNLCLGEE